MAGIGYARVSTLDHDLNTQLDRLTAEGCGIIRSEKVSSGSREGRAELAAAIEFLRPDDELLVARLDQLGCDIRDVLNIIHEVEQRGAFVTVLDPYISTRGQMGLFGKRHQLAFAVLVRDPNPFGMFRVVQQSNPDVAFLPGK